jgi:hypothetical protein
MTGPVLPVRAGERSVIMPHLERTYLKWQWDWLPEALKRTLAAPPWLHTFRNARERRERTR